MLLPTEKPKEFTNLELIREFSRVTEYKINELKNQWDSHKNYLLKNK